MLDRLDGCFTRLIRIAHLNVDWKKNSHHSTLWQLCYSTSQLHHCKADNKFAGHHALRAKVQPISDVILRQPNSTSAKLSYVKTLVHYTGAAKQELKGFVSEQQQ